MKITYRELKVNNYTIRGLLTTPDVPFKQIAVCLHGYTGHKNENGFLFKQLTNLLVKENIATLRFDYMGSGDSDGEFSDQTFDTVLADASAVIDEAYRLNNNQPIYLIGFSMGGACASVMSVRKSDKIEKLVLMSPAGMMDELLTNTFKNNEVIDGKYVDLGGYYVSRNFLDSFIDFPFYKDIETFTKPVLITQGLSDAAVNPRVSKKYKDGYKNSYYVVIPGSQHCYTKVKYRKDVFSAVIGFLK